MIPTARADPRVDVHAGCGHSRCAQVGRCRSWAVVTRNPLDSRREKRHAAYSHEMWRAVRSVLARPGAAGQPVAHRVGGPAVEGAAPRPMAPGCSRPGSTTMTTRCGRATSPSTSVGTPPASPVTGTIAMIGGAAPPSSPVRSCWSSSPLACSCAMSRRRSPPPRARGKSCRPIPWMMPTWACAPTPF